MWLSVIVGVGLGFAYYYFIGCNSGSCPITSNPYKSMLWGGLLGVIFAWPSKKKEEEG
ncbi:MAG: DUF6132 family protein [Breznakibacter sp.]